MDLHAKWEHFLQGRPEADEPRVSFRLFKTEEENYDAHRVTQRALLTVEAPESALIYKLWAVKIRSAAPRLVWFVQTRLKVSS